MPSKLNEKSFFQTKLKKSNRIIEAEKQHFTTQGLYEMALKIRLMTKKTTLLNYFNKKKIFFINYKASNKNKCFIRLKKLVKNAIKI